MHTCWLVEPKENSYSAMRFYRKERYSSAVYEGRCVPIHPYFLFIRLFLPMPLNKAAFAFATSRIMRCESLNEIRSIADDGGFVSLDK